MLTRDTEPPVGHIKFGTDSEEHARKRTHLRQEVLRKGGQNVL